MERRLSSGAVFNLYAADTTRGWHVIGQVTAASAAIKCSLSKWRPVAFAETGEFAGYQMLPPTATPRVMPRLDGTPPTITLAEVQRNAGLFGRSRTLGMPEWKRISRHAKYDEEKILAPEDAIERAIVKVKLWPYPASRIDDGSGEPVYGDRALRCYPHPPTKPHQ